jgi:hypothetical protein
MTTREMFRETLATVASKARAALPVETQTRLDAAVKLVLLGEVQHEPDGAITVGSCTDPMKTYRLVGKTCECQDFVYDKAPGGWCKHRLAAALDRRVREHGAAHDEIPEEPAPVPVPKPTEPLYEAPASVNVRLQIGGREVQWTLRDTSEERLALRLEALLARYPQPQSQAETPVHQGEGWCVKHQVGMKLNEGRNGRKPWWSHRTDEGWCQGR